MFGTPIALMPNETSHRNTESKTAMALILAPDDIAAGAKVAIHSMQPLGCPGAKSKLLLISQSIMPVPPGVPLRVLEVSLPFVACTLLEPDGSESGPIILDVRVIRLCRVSERFVGAITAFGSERCSHNCDCESGDV